MSLDLSRVKLLIVDLDNTLCDTYHDLSLQQWDLVEESLERHGYAAHAARLRATFGKAGFTTTMRKLGMGKRETRIALRAYDSVDVKRLTLFPDAKEFLKLPIPKVLVTRGSRGLQHEKIKHLRIGGYFSQIVIVPPLSRKKEYFTRILKRHKLKKSDALVVGDRSGEEIADATALRIPACHVQKGLKSPTPASVMRVTQLRQLTRLLRQALKRKASS